MVKSSNKAGVGIFTDVVSQKWKLSTIVNCYRGKGDAFERGSYKEVRLAGQNLRIATRVMEKLMRQQVSIGEIQFDLVP